MDQNKNTIIKISTNHDSKKYQKNKSSAEKQK